MTFWDLLEYAAWVLSALIAAWLLRDAYRVGRGFDEDFLVHTMEDLGPDERWPEMAEDSDGARKEES